MSQRSTTLSDGDVPTRMFNRITYRTWCHHLHKSSALFLVLSYSIRKHTLFLEDHLGVLILNVLFHFFSDKNFVCSFKLSSVCYMFHPSIPCWPVHPSNIVEIMKLLVIQLSLAHYYSLPLESKYLWTFLLWNSFLWAASRCSTKYRPNLRSDATSDLQSAFHIG
jgi:hypothetical protein